LSVSGSASLFGSLNAGGDITSSGTVTSNNSNVYNSNTGYSAMGVSTISYSANVIQNPSFESSNGQYPSQTSTTGWSAWGSGVLAQDCTQYYVGTCALKITSTAASGGANYSTALTASTSYTVSFFARAYSSNASGIQMGYGTSSISQTACSANAINGQATTTVTTSGWTQFTCTFTTPSSGSNYLFISSTSASDIFYIDAVQILSGSANTIFNPAGQISINGVVSSQFSLQNTVNSTSSFVINNASGTSLLAADTTNSQVIIGSGANTVALSSTGVTLYGTAQRARTITLTAEYTGAILDNGASDPSYTGSTSGTVGSMTAGFDSSASINSSYGENYYQWTNSQSTAQGYDVVVRIPLPSDFSSFNTTTPFSINTKGSSGANVTGFLWDTGSTTSETSWSFTGSGGCSIAVTTSWVKNTGCTVTGTNTADGIMTLRLRMVAAASGGTVQLGSISIKYLSKW
ncbi:MAG: hypothetical protein WCJ05_02310, partial [bacterium]